MIFGSDAMRFINAIAILKYGIFLSLHTLDLLEVSWGIAFISSNMHPNFRRDKSPKYINKSVFSIIDLITYQRIE
jgi:hypothetical protein